MDPNVRRQGDTNLGAASFAGSILTSWNIGKPSLEYSDAGVNSKALANLSTP